MSKTNFRTCRELGFFPSHKSDSSLLPCDNQSKCIINTIKIIPDLWSFCSVLISVGDSFHAYGEVKCKDDCLIINAPHKPTVCKLVLLFFPHYAECFLLAVFEGEQQYMITWYRVSECPYL